MKRTFWESSVLINGFDGLKKGFKDPRVRGAKGMENNTA